MTSKNLDLKKKSLTFSSYSKKHENKNKIQQILVSGTNQFFLKYQNVPDIRSVPEKTKLTLTLKLGSR